MLTVHIKKTFPGFCLDISFEHSSGNLGILGASGSGKSMTLKCIAGIERPEEGCIAVNGRVLFDAKKGIDLQPRQRRVGYLFQDYALFPNMTVEENIGIGIRDRSRRRQEAAGLIRRFQLEGLEKRYPGQLSGGQRQRAALARMMAAKPELILLDEPFSAMDGHLKEKLQYELMGFLKDYPGDMVLVSHSRDDIYRFQPEVVAIDEGQVLQAGSLWEVFLRPANYKVARLTGCNNISPIIRTGANEVYAVDWDLPLTTAEPVDGDIRYVGIRAHDIRLGSIGICREEEHFDDRKEERRKEERRKENIIRMELLDVVDSPFEYLYHIRAAGSSAKAPIWWKAYKDLNVNASPESFPRDMHIPKEKLLLLS